MRKIVRSLMLAVAVLGTVGALPFADSPALACPNCKAANETDSLKPKAYMYSILFMISMPATLLAGFSFSFYRMWKKQHELTQVSLDGPPAPPEV